MRVSNILVMLGLSAIVACGGGGGSEAPTTSAAPPPPVTLMTGTGNMVAPENFKFSTARPVMVKISAEGFNGQRAYVSLYAQYQSNQYGKLLPVYDSKLSMLTIDGSLATEKLMLTNDVKEVFIRINSVDAGQEPQYAIVAIENDSVSWQF